MGRALRWYDDFAPTVDDEPFEVAHGMRVESTGRTATAYFGVPGPAHRGALLDPRRRLVAIGRRILTGESNAAIARRLKCGHETVRKLRALILSERARPLPGCRGTGLSPAERAVRQLERWRRGNARYRLRHGDRHRESQRAHYVRNKTAILARQKRRRAQHGQERPV